MNRVCLVGRITTKPELKYTQSNVAFTRFTVAVNRPKKEDGTQDADFITCGAWRKQAENICKYLDKGSQVSLEGRIQTGSYTNKDGKKIYTTEVVADSVQFLDTKKKEETTRIGTPADYEQKQETDPFAEIGMEIDVDDNFLE